MNDRVRKLEDAQPPCENTHLTGCRSHIATRPSSQFLIVSWLPVPDFEGEPGRFNAVQAALQGLSAGARGAALAPGLLTGRRMRKARS